MRKSVIWLCVVSFILVTAGLAYAGALKLKLVPVIANGPPEPDASGQVILNYAKGADKTEIQLNCKGLMPKTEYTVYVWQNGGPVSIGSFTSKKGGAGHLHAVLEGDATGLLPIYVSNPLLPAGAKAVLKSE